ncbi:MAG: efflux RND transporter permease subunit [Eubacteriales bacterium]|nr:efflux RND transporter permease subunit [Eubacteriales bacterium]
MPSLPRFSIKRPVCILMCVVSLIVFGLSAILEMPLESMPAMEMPILMIMTSYPNATPEEIDAMVTDVIEASLANITEIKTTYSISQSNSSMVMMQFDYNVDLDKKYSDVDSALSMARLRLPDDCEDPLLMEINIQALSNSSIMMLSLQADASDNTKAYVEDTIVPELERIEGVADVSVSGGTRKYIQVLLNENRMTQYGLAMNSVSTAIASAEYNFGVGTLDRGDVSVALLGNNEFNNYMDIANVPLTLRTGDVIHVSDVATVAMINETSQSYNRTDGKESITLTIAKNQSANTVDICNAVAKAVDKLNQSNLGVQLEVFYDSGAEIKDNIRDVALALLEGMLIAMVVLWLFLGDWKTSLIIGVSMPLSVFAALTLMSAFKMSLNIISLGGLLIGIGMLVDNSIVVIDSCFRAQNEIRSFEDNVIEGANLVLSAIIASTITTIVVFLPIGLMEGMSGQIFHDICYTIIFSLVASLVSAITLVPLLFVRTHPAEKKEGRIANAVAKLENVYVWLMKRLLHKRALVVVTAVVLLLVTAILYFQLGLELMADESNENLTLDIQMRNGLNLENTIDILEKVEDIVKAEPDVKSYSISGGASSGISSLMGGGGNGSVSITLKEDASMTTDEFVTHIRALTASLPNCQVGVSAQQSLSLTATDVQVTLQGKDLTLLKETAFKIKDIMAAMPSFDSVSTSLVDGAPQAKIVVDPLLANAAGLTPAAALMSVNQKISGVKAATYSEGNTDYSIMVEYMADRFSDMSDLYGLMLDTPTGGQVALTDIARVEYCISPESLTRQDGQYLVTISGTPKVGLNINTLTEEVMQAVNRQMDMPQGVTFAEGSDIQTMIEEFQAIGKALLIAIYLVFLVMAIQFESLRFSAIVMISVPFAFTGAFFALFLAGSTINIASLLGLIMLTGIVVNNAIVLIDYTNILRRENSLAADEALLQAGKTRLRPILMTTLTTVCGLIPMAFTASVPVMRSLGVCVIGGLTFSTLVTLVLIPTFYLMFDKEARAKRRADKRARRQEKKLQRKKRITAEQPSES